MLCKSQLSPNPIGLQPGGSLGCTGPRAGALEAQSRHQEPRGHAGEPLLKDTI